MVHKVCVVTGSRADYGLMVRIMRHLASRDLLQLLVTGSHLEGAARTEVEIVADGFNIDLRVPLPPTGRTNLETAAAVGSGVADLANALSTLDPKIVLILGDRFEAFAAAQAAFFLNIPIAHLHGGEITVGSLDDSIRHAISKLARWHFVAHNDAKCRLIRMGEAPESVFVTGAPGLDDVRILRPLSKETLASDLGWDAHAPFLLTTYHPVTNNPEETNNGAGALLSVLSEQTCRIIITGANVDAGGAALNQLFSEFAGRNPGHVRIKSSLGRHRYLSAISHSLAVVGNSSSGIVEAPFLGIPTVNIGSRQYGRPAAASIITCGTSVEHIRDAILQATSHEFQYFARGVETFYGDGNSSKRICDQLSSLMGMTIGAKHFYDA